MKASDASKAVAAIAELQKAARSAQPPPKGYLNSSGMAWLNAGACIALTGTAIALGFIVDKNKTIEVVYAFQPYAVAPHTERGLPFTLLNIYHVWDVVIGYLNVVVTGLGALCTLFMAYVMRMSYDRFLMRRCNPYRWFFEAFSNPLMVASIAMTVGVVDAVVLLMLMAMSMAWTLMLALIEWNRSIRRRKLPSSGIAMTATEPEATSPGGGRGTKVTLEGVAVSASGATDGDDEDDDLVTEGAMDTASMTGYVMDGKRRKGHMNGLLVVSILTVAVIGFLVFQYTMDLLKTTATALPWWIHTSFWVVIGGHALVLVTFLVQQRCPHLYNEGEMFMVLVGAVTKLTMAWVMYAGAK